MCGIAGIVSTAGGRPPTTEQLAAMAAALRHRGPDEFGIYRDRAAGLAHARLSIIDLATGQQPLANETSTLWITFNGEIYNFVELRNSLESVGHRFRTLSDTEVIVHAYEEWGDETFARFNGQFAIALWDSTRKKLVLARDRFGVRPIYFHEHGGRVYFASEVKAIFAADPAIPRKLDATGLEQTFTFWSVLPPRSVFEGIVELEPGSVRTYEAGRVRERRFVSSAYPRDGKGEFKGTAAEGAEALRAALARAVELRILRADVPVGSYLSGGLDSSVIAALGHRVKGDRFHTFSLRFEDAEYDETRYQRAMAEHIGSHHHEVLVSRKDIGSVFPDVVEMTERPILRAAPAPLYLLSKLVHESGFKVVLTGEGADEMLAGYDLFREAKIRRFWARQPGSVLRPRLLERLYPYLARSPVATREMARSFFGRDLDRWRTPEFSHLPRWQTTAALKRLFSGDVRAANATGDVVEAFLGTLPPESAGWSFLARDQYIEIATLFSSYLLSSQGDRMLMAHSVEGRFPFLDIDVVALAESFPPEFKLRGLEEKHVLKRAATPLLPPAVLSRQKQPYRVPDAASFVGESAPDWVPEMIAPDAVREAGVFDPLAVERLWRKCRDHPPDRPFSNADNMALTGVLSTQLLHDRFIRRHPGALPAITLRTMIECGGEAG